MYYMKRKATLKDVARLSKVSTVTVSNVLNGRPNVSERTRTRVLNAIKRTNYSVNLAAKGLAGGHTNMLGVLIPDLATQYMGEIVWGISQEARQNSLEMLLSTALDVARERNQLNFLENITDGLILVLPHNTDDNLRLSLNGKPVVMVDHRGSTIKLPSIDVDNYAGGRMATEYLLRLDHRRIGFISGFFEASASRFRGYKEALVNAGISFDPTLVVAGDFYQPSGFNGTNQLLNLSNPPTAIFAANDLMAFGALEAIKEHGLRVPQDISVIGFDDIPMANQVFPPLTTIRQPLAEMGRAAVRMMLAKLRGVEPPSHRITLATELVERASTRTWRNRSGSKEEVMINKTGLDIKQRKKDAVFR
jgi:LacI family transcriptional regulator